MKKFILSLTLMSFALTAGAQGTMPSVSLTSSDYPPGKYYGSKAGDGPFNPCKGKAKTICAEIKASTSLGNSFGANTLSLTNEDSDSNFGLNILWRVPLNTPDEDFARIKAWEMVYPNLKVVKGLEEETTEEDLLDEE